MHIQVGEKIDPYMNIYEKQQRATTYSVYIQAKLFLRIVNKTINSAKVQRTNHAGINTLLYIHEVGGYVQ